MQFQNILFEFILKFILFILYFNRTKNIIMNMNTNKIYDDAPMMDMVKFNQVEGIDLNLVDGETLSFYYTLSQVIWVTEIHLTEKK